MTRTDVSSPCQRSRTLPPCASDWTALKKTKKVKVRESDDVTNNKGVYYSSVQVVWHSKLAESWWRIPEPAVDSQTADIGCLWSTHVHLQPHTGSPPSSPSDRLRPDMKKKKRFSHRHVQSQSESMPTRAGSDHQQVLTFSSSFLSALPSVKPRIGSFFTSTAAQGNVLNLQTHKHTFNFK